MPDSIVLLRKSVNLKKSGEGLGNKKLYAMGFDGACIGTLRKLTAEQVDEMRTNEPDPVAAGESAPHPTTKRLGVCAGPGGACLSSPKFR